MLIDYTSFKVFSVFKGVIDYIFKVFSVFAEKPLPCESLAVFTVACCKLTFQRRFE